MQSAIPRIVSEKSEEQREKTVASNNHSDYHFTVQQATHNTYIFKRQSSDKISVAKDYQKYTSNPNVFFSSFSECHQH